MTKRVFEKAKEHYYKYNIMPVIYVTPEFYRKYTKTDPSSWCKGGNVYLTGHNHITGLKFNEDSIDVSWQTKYPKIKNHSAHVPANHITRFDHWGQY